jgi:hypothetical protein
MKYFLLSLFVCSLAFGKTQSFKLEGNHPVTVTFPDSWEAVRDLFGIPLAVLGPYENDSRPVLSILPTTLKKSQTSETEFQKVFVDFKKEKDEWVQSHKGQLISYEPMKAVDFGKELKGHFIGAEFKINDVHFIERSYYLWCKDEVYNLKYSIRNEHKKYLNELQKMVGEFKCN